MAYLPLPKLRRYFAFEEIILLLLAFFLTSASAWWVHHLGLTLALTDAAAHLNFSKLVSDSLTPGISQIGFWPPLLQIIMAPFSAIPALYVSGLAGYVALVPFIMAATVFLYRIVQRITGSRLFGTTAALLFLLNPYVLYYGSVPMMEMLFVANVLGSGYFLLRWLESKDLKYIIWLGVFVTLAILSRYEGLLLLPIIGGVLLADLYRQRSSKLKTEATMLLFAMIAMVGILFILLYGWVFGGSPLAFTSSDFVRDPAANLTITKFSLVKTIEYFSSASGILIGSGLVLLALLGALVTLFQRENRFRILAVLSVLLSPALFVLITMFLGHESVLTPGLPPYDFFHNDRYALTWIGFVAAAPFIALYPLRSLRAALIRPLLAIVCFGVVAFSAYHLVQVAFVTRYPAITHNINGPVDAQRPDQVAAAAALKEHYDFGYVLVTRFNEDPFIHEVGIPLKKYIYEGNYRYFDQAQKEPQVFARFVITHNPDDVADVWSTQHETLTKNVLTSPDFAKYYTLIYQNKSRRIYQVNQAAVVQLASERGYNPQLIPSLAPHGAWDPLTVYSSFTGETASADVVTNKVALDTALQASYRTDLRPGFINGYQVDASGNGNSENQALALRLAFQANDEQTFDTVWKWTQSHLERPDHLLSSQFIVSVDGSIMIKDSNSATSADLDIARSLLQAGRSFHVATYGEQGSRLANAIWEHDSEYDGQGRRHLLAGNWGRLTDGFVMNAQALDVDALQSFILIDPSHDWAGLKSQTLTDLQTIGQSAFSGRPGGLPTNWAILHPVQGTFGHYTLQVGADDYSYGAFRAIYFATQDAKSSQDPATIRYLKTITAFIDQPISGTLCAVFIDGKKCYNDSASLSAPLGQLTLTDQAKAQDLMSKTLLAHGTVLVPKSDFFQAAWYWFGLNAWSRR